jgi:CheY-like chemotaxis protein
MNIQLGHLVFEPRPLISHPTAVYRRIAHAADVAFPSDHSAAAFALATVLVASARTIAQRERARWVTTSVSLLGLLSAVSIAVARVYVGVQYPGDVLGAAICGIFGGLIALTQRSLLAPLLPPPIRALGQIGMARHARSDANSQIDVLHCPEHSSHHVAARASSARGNGSPASATPPNDQTGSGNMRDQQAGKCCSSMGTLGARKFWGVMNMAYVLIVDDDQDFRDAVRFILEDADHEVLDVSDGESALRILRESHKRLVVLLDMLIPRLNGIDLLRAVVADPLLKERHAYLLMTANSMLLRRQAEPLLAEVSAKIVGKPFDMDNLLAIIDDTAADHRVDDPCP